MRLLAPLVVVMLFFLGGCATSGPAAQPPAARVDPAGVRLAWERLQGLQGDWIGRSTKGWTETANFSLIAQGSCLVESSFDAHPGERMLTIFHVDGDRLLLTHYCVARNQPRLCLTSSSPDASRLEFTFLDITGVPSRDRGHMDRLVVEFLGDGRAAFQWSWYQAGKESWMERIELTPATREGGGPPGVAPTG